MYGTIARLRVKQGMDEQLRKLGQEARDINGLVFEYLYRADSASNEYWLVVGFESKAAYQANANSPEQHQRYLAFRDLLDADPEWHDGEIVDSYVR